jgi:hypothetical protein
MLRLLRSGFYVLKKFVAEDVFFSCQSNAPLVSSQISTATHFLVTSLSDSTPQSMANK